MKKRLIVASSSPRRIELLSKLQIEFEVFEPEAKEDAVAADPHTHALTMARLKARWVAERVDSGIVLGADTVVTIDGTVLGKPESEEEAFSMLELLSGRRHKVVTGVVLIDALSGKELSEVCETDVEFRSLTHEEIASYIESGEPFDKAGGYGIQGLGSTLVKGVKGDFYTVVGLPLSRLVELLKEFGVP